MLDLSGTSIAQSEAAGRQTATILQFKWGGVSWVTETSRLISAHLTLSASDSAQGVVGLSRGTGDTLEITLDNADGRFTPTNSSSPIYQYIRDGKLYGTLVALHMGFYNAQGQAETVQRFIGQVVSWDLQEVARRVRVKCSDFSLRFTTRPIRTGLYTNIRPSDMAEVVRTALPSSVRPLKGTWSDSYITIPAAWADEDNAWQELCDLAEAEGGAVYLNAQGKLCFLSSADILGEQTPVAAFGRGDCEDIRLSYEWQSQANRIRVSYKPAVLSWSDDVWSLPAPRIMGAGETITILAQMSSPVLNPTVGEVYARTFSGLDCTDQIQVTATFYAQQAVIKVVNNASEVVLLDKLVIKGNPLLFLREEWVAAVVDANGSITFESPDYNPLGSDTVRPLEIRGNWYIQTRETAERLAWMLAWRTARPAERWTLSGVGGKFWFDPLDRITINPGTGDIPALVHSVDIDIGAGYAVTLTAYSLASLVPAGLSFFRLGTDALGGGMVYFP